MLPEDPAFSIGVDQFSNLNYIKFDNSPTVFKNGFNRELTGDYKINFGTDAISTDAIYFERISFFRKCQESTEKWVRSSGTIYADTKRLKFSLLTIL